MKKLVVLLVGFSLVAAACGTSAPPATPTASPSPSAFPSSTRTLPPTPLLPTKTATTVSFEGTLTTKVNVRSGPGTSYDSLGQLDAGGKVQVLFRDSLSAWYQIIYPTAPEGYGWVSAQYVTLATGSVVPLDATPTPTGPTGQVMQRLNVRSGPGTTFDSLGMLEPGASVFLTGKNTTNSWFQIDYAAGPGGLGWVTSQYVQTDRAADLPVLDDFGNVVTPGAGGTPADPVLAPTPTVGPAIADGDSSANPAVKVTFSTTGTHEFIYTSQVSAPQGDPEDWVEFTPYSVLGLKTTLTFSLTCSGNGSLTVELWQNSAQLTGWGSLACGDEGKLFQVSAGQPYTLRLAPAATGELILVTYTLSIQNNP